jgi:hypothetical protein
VAAADPAGPPPSAVTSQRAGRSAAADGTAEPSRAHLAAAPIAPAEANSAAAVTPPVLGRDRARPVAIRALDGHWEVHADPHHETAALET